jgi:hypothetical protein
MMKPKTMSAIHAPGPNWSSFATIAMSASRYRVNVNNIHIRVAVDVVKAGAQRPL